VIWYSSSYDNPYSKQQLSAWLHKYPDLEGIAIITSDGRHIASILPKPSNQNEIDLIAASVAECMSMAVTLTHLLDRAKPDPQIYIKTTSSLVYVSRLKNHYLAIFLCKSGTKLNLSFLDGPSSPPPSSAPDPIFPRQPPKQLTASAKPDFDNDD
jgi:predicted regulator of Ras-like GTPase activity (Roadblock/LC7/MglB family)